MKAAIYGVIYVYYCGIPPSPGSPKSDMGVLISRDNGATFTATTMRIEGKVAAGAVDPAGHGGQSIERPPADLFYHAQAGRPGFR